VAPLAAQLDSHWETPFFFDVAAIEIVELNDHVGRIGKLNHAATILKKIVVTGSQLGTASRQVIFRNARQ
jgi:hypothetical protein